MATRERVLTAATAQDAREFGLHVKQGGWRLGLLVARNVVKSPGRVSIESLSPKTNATRFAQLAETSNDRVLRYLNAWEQAADAGLVPHANELTPTTEPDLDVDTLPSWSQYYRPEVRRTGRPPTAVAVTLTPEEQQRRQQEQDEEHRRQALAQQRRQEAFSAEVQRQQDRASNAQRSLTDNAVDEAGARYRAEQAMRDARRAELDGTDDQSNAAAVHADMALEVSELVGKLKWFTRRLYDLSRDQEWLTTDGTRAAAADAARTLSQQLALVADIAADPESALVTDEAIRHLLS